MDRYQSVLWEVVEAYLLEEDEDEDEDEDTFNIWTRPAS